MFEFGRELKRLFDADPPRDGLTGGDASLLELLELNLLCAEARAADIAAGRISAKNRPERQLEAAIVWRELARRTGDAVALRKAAAAAETSAMGYGRDARPLGWARARGEQARAALLGAALYGDQSLNTAAEFALAEVQKAAANSPAAAVTGAALALVEARKVIGRGDRDVVVEVARQFDGPIASLRIHGRRRAASRLLAAEASADRADLLAAGGVRLKDPMLLRMALDGVGQALSRLDPAYEPVTWAVLATLGATTRAALGELEGDVTEVAAAVNELVAVLGHVAKDHSPLDWAHAQQALAGVLQILGEATDCDRALDQAAGCYERAMTVFAGQSALVGAAVTMHNRAQCLARRAELRGDLTALAEVELDLRADLAASNAAGDPVAWGVRQLNFARVYEARANIGGFDPAGHNAAAEALTAALEVFGEHGQRDLADTAATGLARLKTISSRLRIRGE